jgi:hypothetical protein
LNKDKEQLVLVLKRQAKGRKATPWLDPYRDRFARAARETAEELKDSPLRGADRVRAVNARISEKLKKKD